jgi:predicted glutamine amidotransferase
LIRRKVESLIPDELYGSRTGTTDSEALFLVALANGLAHDPVAAMARTLSTVRALMHEAGITEPLRFAAALTNGQDLFAFRWASDDKPPTLYWRERDGALLVVSEPIDHTHEGWNEIPLGAALEARFGQTNRTRCLNQAMKQAA